MGLEISSTLLARLLNDAATAPGEEICGLLLGSSDCVDGALACRNLAADPRSAFEIDPATLIATHKAARAGGPSIIGCYHSHPNGTCSPSARDAAAAAADATLWLILADGQARFYRAVEKGAIEGRFVAVSHRTVER